MSGSSDDSKLAGAMTGVVVFVVVIWWLRWFILVGLAVALLVQGIRWARRRRAQLLAAELDRTAAIRQRAEIQNEQILRGDPAGFFGAYPVPDLELIPPWYTIDRPAKRQPRHYG